MIYLSLKNAGCIKTDNFEGKGCLTIFLLLDSPIFLGQGFLVVLPRSLASLWLLTAIIWGWQDLCTGEYHGWRKPSSQWKLLLSLSLRVLKDDHPPERSLECCSVPTESFHFWSKCSSHSSGTDVIISHLIWQSGLLHNFVILFLDLFHYTASEFHVVLIQIRACPPSVP